jgi:hypothetical protein
MCQSVDDNGNAFCQSIAIMCVVQLRRCVCTLELPVVENVCAQLYTDINNTRSLLLLPLHARNHCSMHSYSVVSVLSSIVVTYVEQHFLNFLPLPHLHGSFGLVFLPITSSFLCCYYCTNNKRFVRYYNRVSSCKDTALTYDSSSTTTLLY